MHRHSTGQSRRVAVGPALRRRPAARGAAYLMLLVAVATLGIAAAGSATLGAAASRQDAERQLLATGSEFEAALASYRAASPPTRPATGPQELADLLKDPRTPGLRRHLRQVRADPITGKIDWGLVRARDGGIVGLYSQAPGRPQKQRDFAPAQAHFELAEGYGDWIFTATPEALPRRRGVAPQPAASAASAASGAASQPDDKKPGTPGFS